MKDDPVAIARAAYEAYERKDRTAIEELIAEDFHFSSPLDNHLDRETYFSRCWSNSQTIAAFDASSRENVAFSSTEFASWLCVAIEHPRSLDRDRLGWVISRLW